MTEYSGFKGAENLKPFDSTEVRPYGDTYNDGMVQLSFTLPVPSGAKAVEAAKIMLIHMGFQNPAITLEKDLGEGFTFFIAYAKTEAYVDFTCIEVPELKTEVLSRSEIDKLIKEKFNRKLVIVGACTGEDAHTVGIDAILNMKGVDQHYGLERYEMFEVHNLGSQVTNEQLVQKANELKADALLVSQIVTQKDVHITNLTDLINIGKEKAKNKNMLFVAGGPRISHELAIKLGFDAGFGSNTYPEEVASFIFETLKK